ncbi:hypothetical protein E2320_002201, partial [Naja naja]
MSTKEEIITRAMSLHNTLGLPTAHRVDFSQIHLFEDHFGITIKIVFYHEGGWRFFVTGGTLDVRVVFMLLHDKHYYGVKNIKGFMGAHYFCEMCLTCYHHKFKHDCQYFCMAVRDRMPRRGWREVQIHVFEEGYHHTSPSGQLPEEQESFSACSIQWLLCIEHTEGIHIQHALQGGEKKVVINGVLTAFEFYGCFFTDVLYVTSPRTSTACLILPMYEASGNMNEETMLKNNEGLKRFLAGRITHSFEPQRCLFGGRTNANCFLVPTEGALLSGTATQVGGKLMFSLCAICTEKQQVTVCHHNDEERALTGTWCTVELSVAVEKGYRIAEIYEVWHFERKTKSLFSDYINMHLHQKQEASGYPDWCKTEEDKECYVRDYKKNKGVQLCREYIEYNPAKRQIAKLFLNSLWGKFSQSTNHLTTMVVTEPEELFMYLFVPYYEVSSCEFVDDEAAVLKWKAAKNQPTKSTCTNVFIASFTMAYARLELYSLLERLGDRCLYHDTDS